MTTTDSKAVKKLNAMKTLLDIFSVRHEMNRKNRLKKAETFISDFIAMQRGMVNSREEAQLNVFDILSFGNNEVALSSLLSWFLNEHSRHYHGSLFLKTLVTLCDLKLPLESLIGYRVDTEHSEQEAIIDIKVYKKREFLIYIENKIFAAEGDDQTPREYRDMKRVGAAHGIPENRQFAIFLTPDGREPKDRGHWHPLSLDALVEAFIRLGDEIRSPKLLYILEDLHDTAMKWRQS